jgi:hypothetical protein
VARPLHNDRSSPKVTISPKVVSSLQRIGLSYPFDERVADGVVAGSVANSWPGSRGDRQVTDRTISNLNRAVALAFVLALAVFNTGSALAKAGGADRPVKGTASGTLRLNPVTGAATGDITGVTSHLGKTAVHFEGTLTPTAEAGTFAGPATVTIVAANGDRLTGVAAVTSRATSTGRITTVVLEIAGGTGRFANASGTLTVTCVSGPPSQEGQILVFAIECKATGRISY